MDNKTATETLNSLEILFVFTGLSLLGSAL